MVFLQKLRIFAAPEYVSSRPTAESKINCPLYGGGSGNAHTVTHITEDT